MTYFLRLCFNIGYHIHDSPTLRTHHTDAAWHSPLAADITAHPLQKLRWWCSTVWSGLCECIRANSLQTVL